MYAYRASATREVLWSIETNNARNKEDFLSSEKKSKAKNKKNDDGFRKVIIYNQAPDALPDWHASKYKASQ